MTLAVFTWESQWGTTTETTRAQNVARFAGVGESRSATASRVLRAWSHSFRVNRADRDAIEDFFEDLGAASFLWKPYDGYNRYGASIGTGDGAEANFTLPTTGKTAGDYPLTAPLVLYANGTPAAGSVVTDTQTFTFDAAPTDTHVLTADYELYRRVKIVSGVSWDDTNPPTFDGTARFQEVVPNV